MKKHILLVEDDTFLSQLYCDLLKSEGYEVTTIIDGKEAFTKIKDGTWDLILLDVMLPGMDGFTIVEKLKAEKKKPHCLIIFMTNLDSNDSDKKQLEMADGFWIKSNMAPPDFIAKVKEVLQG